MELQLPIVSYITAKKMLFTSKAIILNKTDIYEQMPIRVKFNNINEYLCFKMNKYSEKRINTGKNK
jgi:hypothetical protein